MNHIYRLVWNRAKRVMQVTSEIGSSAGGDCIATTAPGLRRTPLALVCAGLLGLGSAFAAMPASAVDIDVTASSTPLDLIVDTAGPGNISQSGPITVGGTTTLTADGTITLTNAGNDFQGAVWATGTSIAITDVDDLSIAAASNDGNGAVSLVAGDTLTLSSAINAGTGNLTLASNGGVLAPASALSGANLSLTGRNGITLAGDLTAAGTLTLTSTNTGIAQAGGSISAGGNTTVNAGTGAIVLTSAGNDFTGTVSLSGGNTQISDANALTLGSLNTGALTAISGGALDLGSGTVNGNLLATSATSITLNGALVGLGDVFFSSGSGPTGSGSVAGTGSISGIDSATFNLTGTKTGTSGGITFNGFVAADATQIAGAVDFDDGNPGSLGMTFAGATDVAGSGDISNVSGSFDLGTMISSSSGIDYSGFVIDTLAGSGGSATITGSNQSWSLTGHNQGTVTNLAGTFSGIGNLIDTGTGHFIMHSGADGDISGNLDGGTGGSLDYSGYTTSVAVNLSGSGTTGVSGTTSGIAAVTASSSLGVSGSAIGALTITTTGAGTTTTLGTAMIGGDLSITASGDVLQTGGALSIAGTSTIDAGTNAITLTGGSNDFGGVVSLTGGTTQITDINALTLGTLATGALTATSHGALNLGSGSIGGSLEANSNGFGIQQTGALTVTGDMSLDAGAGGDIELTDLDNDFQGALDLSAVQILLAAANDLHIASLTIGADQWVVLQAGGTLTLANGAIDTGTGSLVLISNGGSLASTSALSGWDVTLTGRDGITLGGDVGASDTLTLSTQNAAIVQGAGNIVAVDASVNTGTGAITLTGASNDFTGTVDLVGGSTQINDANALTLGTLATGALTATSHGALNLGAGDIGGALAATSNNGAISQGGALAVTGSATINAGTGAITLTNAGNDFTGAVSLTGGNTQIKDANALILGTLATGALTATSSGALTLGGGSIGGDLAANSNNGAISQGGALAVTGSSTIDAGTGTVTLTNVGNDFQGSIDVSGASIAIADANDLDIAALGNGANGTVSLDAGGVLTLVAGAIDTGTGNLILQSAGGALATPGALSGNNISLYAGDGLTIASDITAGGGITLFGGTGSIVQTGGAITGLGLAGGGATAGDIVLNSVGNTIGMLGGFEAASFSLVNNTALLIDEHSTITGDMRIDNGISTITLIGTIDAGRMLLDSGFMRIGNGGTVGTLAGDLVLGGSAAFQHSDDIVYAGDISGSGTLNQQGTGALVLDGDSSAFAGSTMVDSGSLVVGGSAGNGAMLGGDVAVTAGATLGGHGSIGGDVDIANGATLAPGNSIGTLTIDGNLHLAQGSTLDYEFGAPGANFNTPGASDRVNVGGNLAIDGATLDVTDTGGMGAGLYTVLSWGGTLTQSNGGLSLGTVPGGQDLQLQFLGDRINVLSISGLELNFWNANGAATSSQLGGGSGTWSATSANWTDADATATAAMNPQPGFAIFGGASGTVTVDDGAGAVAASGLQFASNGYRMTGDTLTLVGSGGNAPVIRVGDGSVAGAAMTATIDSVIAGSDGLDKADAGTLVLAGANTYSGGTTISGGTLQVGSDASLGAAGEDIALDGGTLATTGSFATTRDIVVGNAGGGLRTGADMTLDGAITGAGILHTAGTITLTNAGNNFGGASIDAGTLALSGAGVAPGTLAVAGGAVFDISQADAGATIAGLSGAGHVALGDQALTVNRGTSIFDGTLGDGGIGGGTGGSLVLGSGLLTLTGTNTYTGATTIAGGATLALAGGGGIADSVQVVVDGTFDIAGTSAGATVNDLTGTGDVVLGDQTLTLAGSGDFAGDISGAGAVHQLGGGTQVLLGNLGHTGGTTIDDGGMLQVGDGGTSGNLVGTAVDNGTLAFNRSDAFAFDGAISGNGRLQQQGTGTLVLDGDSSAFSGDTTVQSGGLVVGSAAGNGAALGGDVAVVAGATLGGHGRIGGDVDIASDATLAPGTSIGTLTVDGNLHLAQGSTLDYEFGAPGSDYSTPGASDRVDVGGNLAIDGATLDVTDAGGMGAGLYTVLSWGGTLARSNSGLALGAVPGDQELQLQFLGDRINLLNISGLELNFWNANGAATATQLGGGSGTWSVTSSNWTDANAIATAAMNPQPGFAIFGGASGTVTVEDGASAVAASGLQFASDGYRMAGDTLTLIGSGGIAPVIRVGDGSAAGASMTATIDNVIAGSDGLRKDDAGTLVLAGANTYSGGTTIAGGTLQVGSDANLGAADEDILLDGGTLAATGGFATTRNIVVGSVGGGLRTDTATSIDGAISGDGVLWIQGGSLVLGGNSVAFAGGTQVAGGRLVVGGSAGSAAVLGGDVSVAAGAILGGHGRIGGDVVNAGTVAPGYSIGILTIGGDYTQTATGALQIEAQADGQADQLVVEGGATLDGSMLVLAQDGDWRPQTDYTILTAGGGISGQFGTASSSLVFLDPLLAYGNNAVTLTLRRNDVAFASAAATANQTGVATAADALGWGNPVYTALTTLDAPQAAAAFDALSGEIHVATRGALLEDSRQLEQTVVLQSASVPIDARGAWISGWGHWAESDGDGNAAAVDSEGNGIAIGAGIPLGEHARIGAVLGTSKLDVRSDARASHSDVDSRHAGIHVRLDTPVVNLQAGVLRSWHDIGSDRTVAFTGYQDSLQADADADTTQVFVDASRVFDLGDVQLIPFANIARVKLRGDAFDETGGTAALQVDVDDVARTLASVGLHGEWQASDSTHLWASVGWMHASGDDRVVGQQRFADGATSFTTTSVALADSTALLDAGLRWQPGARTTLEAAYNGRFGDGLRDQGARVSLRWAF